MGEILRNFFEHLLALSNPFWLYYPLCAVAAVVYKATKFDDPKEIARHALNFFLWVTGGMFVLGVVFYILSRLF
ncbi:MAG: hypothetical protein NT049_06005 [Planctomycetota bacterium]|nr:hypothetical protein [Planctomycetota bacterium]